MLQKFGGRKLISRSEPLPVLLDDDGLLVIVSLAMAGAAAGAKASSMGLLMGGPQLSKRDPRSHDPLGEGPQGLV